MNRVYSIVGLGKLGASMAAAIAKRGFDVIGVDVNRRAVELMNEGRAPVWETDLETTISAHRRRIRATVDVSDAVMNSDVTFVIVPTPSDERGAFSLKHAAAACREIGRALAKKQGYHLVVLTSTVLPGSCRSRLIPLLEKESGRRCGPDFGVCYGPEFIALGSVIHDFLNPDFTLVGEFDERSGGLLESCYSTLMENHPPCRRMSLENAELTKISVNAFVTTKMTFANMLADLCMRIPGGNVDVVTHALGADKRIGAKYLKGALGYGGPCFPRDNVALSFLAKALGGRAELAEATDRINRSLVEGYGERLQAWIKPGMRVAVLGLAYKPYSDVIEESQGVQLVRVLARRGVRVAAFDPLAGAAAKPELKGEAVIADSVEACMREAEVVLITTPDPAFAGLTSEDFLKGKREVVVVDFWRVLAKALAGRPGIRYVPFGCSINDDGNARTLEALWGETGGEKN